MKSVVVCSYDERNIFIYLFIYLLQFVQFSLAYFTCVKFFYLNYNEGTNKIVFIMCLY